MVIENLSISELINLVGDDFHSLSFDKDTKEWWAFARTPAISRGRSIEEAIMGLIIRLENKKKEAGY